MNARRAISLLRIFRKHTAFHLLKVFTFLFAWNYFAFRVELFDEEYERNHPVGSSDARTAAFSLPSLNWETFDKDNAPKAVKVEPFIFLTLLSRTPDEQFFFRPVISQHQIIRDKSPPFSPGCFTLPSTV